MNRLILATVLSFSTFVVSGWAQSAWLPTPGQFTTTPGFSYQTFDLFWAGRTLVDPLRANHESLDQYAGFVLLQYGIWERFAADATIGYTETTSTKTFGGSDSGLADTDLGLRYRLIEETALLPTISLRVGGIIPGTYDENKAFSAGDGAYGFESSLLFGKSFGSSGFGAYGDIGYRVRENPVPDSAFGSVGVFKQIASIFSSTDAFTLSFGYRHVQGLNGIDIGGPGFNPSLGKAHGFPATRQIDQLVEGSLGYTDTGGRQYQFSVAHSVDGRNVGDKLVFVFTVRLPFGGH